MKATWHQLSIKINWQKPTRFMTNYMKTCSFLHAQFTETMKVVENLLKTFFVTNSFIKRLYVVSSHWKAVLMCSNNICYLN